VTINKKKRLSFSKRSYTGTNQERGQNAQRANRGLISTKGGPGIIKRTRDWARWPRGKGKGSENESGEQKGGGHVRGGDGVRFTKSNCPWGGKEIERGKKGGRTVTSKKNELPEEEKKKKFKNIVERAKDPGGGDPKGGERKKKQEPKSYAEKKK